MALIKVSHLNKIYRMGDTAVKALDDISLEIERGEFLAIMGPSGSGKSTLMHVLGLLDMPDSGTYAFEGKTLTFSADKALAGLRSRKLGFIFQQFHLMKRTSALDNVLLPGIYLGSKDQKNHAQKLLGKVGLGDRLSHKSSELSGGQQQRVAIARSLLNSPAVIFADEPSGNLDSKSEEEIMALLCELNAAGITIIMVTHEEELKKLATRVIKMRDGKILSDERNKPINYDPRVKEDPLLGQIENLQRPNFLTMLFVFFGQALKSLLANKVRSFLSMLGILIGVASVIAMLALGAGAKVSIEKQLATLGTNLLSVRPGPDRHMGVSSEAVTATFTVDDGERLKREVSGIASLAPSVSGRVQAVYRERNTNTRVLGTTPEYSSMRAAPAQLGRFFTDQENIDRARVALIGKTIATNLFAGKNPIGETLRLNRINFQIIGVLQERGAGAFGDQDDIIIIPIHTAMYRLLGKTSVDSFDVEVKDRDNMENVSSSILRYFAVKNHITGNPEDSLTVRNYADIQSAVSQTSKIMSLLLAIIALISLVVGGIGIMNIMLVSVTERTREIGIRMAVGARRADILLQFIIEAIFTSFIGGLMGIALGVLASSLIGIFSGWEIIVTTGSVLLATLFSVVVGVIFGYWPALKASRLSAIEAIRFE